MEAKTNQKKSGVKEKAKVAGQTTLEYVETIIILLYIVNGVATFLILWDLVEASDLFKKLAGALAFSFSAFALVAFTNKGVKHQSTSKKGKR